MLELSKERWAEIKEIAYQDKIEPISLRLALKDVILRYDHLSEQVLKLGVYLLNERPNDPAWKLAEGACAMAVAIMRREKHELIEINDTLRWCGEGYDD